MDQPVSFFQARLNLTIYGSIFLQAIITYRTEKYARQ